jgi:hypothetical protein
MNKIRIIGIIAILYGLFNLINSLTLIRGIQSSGIMMGALIILNLLVLLALVIGGISFILVKNWGRIVLLTFLIIDICLRIFGICNYLYVYFTSSKAIIIPKGAYVIKLSMIPSYIILTIEIIVLYIITRKDIKEIFNKKGI